MSSDVGGWIEVRKLEAQTWRGIERVNGYIDRADGMMACLFGIGGGDRFRPIAPDRGIPGDASPEVGAEVAAEHGLAASSGWATYAEIAGIDWDETAMTTYERFIRTKRGGHVAAPGHDTRQQRERLEDVLSRMGGWPENTDEIEVDDLIYRRQRTPRSAFKSEDWQLLFRKMEHLTTTYGPDGVRVVAWIVA